MIKIGIRLEQDICIDETAFNTASSEMSALNTRTETLKTKLQGMYTELINALDTPAGKQLKLTAGDVLIKPIDDMLLVIQHISATLGEIIGTGYYKGVFVKFTELNQSVKF